MILTTTHTIAGYKIDKYIGLVNANQVVGANFLADFFASFSDVFGGNSGAYRERLDGLYKGIKDVLEKKASSLGANAILGIHIDFDEISGKGKSMFMITAYGTAVEISPIVEPNKEVDRYEVYQKLYNLYKFKEAGVINEEQYEVEKNNIILTNEKNIKEEIDEIKTDNEHKEAVKQAQILSQQLAEEREKEKMEKLQRQKEEAERKMSEEESAIKLRKQKEPEIENAYNSFLNKSSLVIVEIRNLLCSNLSSPQEQLDKMTFEDVKDVSYENLCDYTNNSAAFIIGQLLRQEKVAEACKYYIDLVGDEDIEEAKSYVQGIYDLMTLKNQSAFEKVARNLIELKCLGKIDEAINEFSKYAICDKNISKHVIELL